LELLLRGLSLQNPIPGIRLKSGKVSIHKETYFKASSFKHKSEICLHTFIRRIFMHLSLRQLTSNSLKESNDDVFSKTGGENVVLVNLKLLLHISIVNSNHSYINHFFQISPQTFGNKYYFYYHILFSS